MHMPAASPEPVIRPRRYSSSEDSLDSGWIIGDDPVRSSKAAPQGFINSFVIAPDAVICTDEASAYEGLPNHKAATYSTGEYVRGMAHTNGMESFWSMLKRAHTDTFHKMSPKPSESLRHGVRRAVQHSRAGHGRPAHDGGPVDGREAAPLP